MIDAFARSCSNNESAIGTPAISAGPSSGTATWIPANVANDGASLVVDRGWIAQRDQRVAAR